MNTLMTRTFTAIIFVAVVLGGLYYSRFSFAILFFIIAILCLWEFFGLILDRTQAFTGLRKIYGVLIGGLPVAAASIGQLHYGELSIATWTSLAASYLVLLFGVFIFELFAKAKTPFTLIGQVILGLFYIGLPFALLNFIAFHQGTFYPNIVFGILWLTWTNDSAAYLVGSQIGKTPLFPRISPKKTWEGSMGGVVFTFLMGGILSYFFKELSLTNWLVLASLVAVFASLGDLIESMLKRSLGVKDSGSFLPGHGGFLDRFDAFIFLIPFVAAYLFWVKGI